MATEAIIALRSAELELSEVADWVLGPSFEVEVMVEAIMEAGIGVCEAIGGLMSKSVSSEVEAGFPLSIETCGKKIRMFKPLKLTGESVSRF